MDNIADGKVTIDVLLNDGSVVKGVANLDQQLGGLERSGNKGSMGIGKIVTSLGLVKVAGKAISMIGGQVDAAFGRIDTMNAFSRTITTLTGDSEAANRALEDLKGVTKGTAYGLDVAAKATQNFVTRGMGLKEATTSVGAWADAVAFYGKGTNEELSSVADALAKMRTKGKVEMDQLNRLFDVGIDAVGMYAQAHNMSAADVQTALSKGSISAADFLDTVEKGMLTGEGGIRKIAGAAKEAGASWAGTFANMKAATTRGVVSIIQALDQGFGDAGLGTIKQNIAALGGLFEKTLGNIAKAIPPVLNAIGTIAKPILDLMPVIQKFATLIGVFVTGYTDVKRFSSAFNDLKAALPESIADGFMSSLSKALATINDFKTGILGLVKVVTGSITDFQGLEDYLGGAFGDEGVQRILTLGEQIRTVFTNIVDIVKIAFKSIFEVFSALIPVVIAFFNVFATDAIDSSSNALTSFSDIAKAAFEFIGDIVTNVVVPALESLAEWISKNEGLVKALAAVLIGGFVGFKVFGVITKLVTTTTTALGFLSKGLGIAKIAFTTLSNLGIGGTIKMLLGFANPVTLIIAAIVGLVAAVIYFWKTNENFRNAVKAIWAQIVSFFQSAWETIKKVWSGTGEFFSSVWESITKGVKASVDFIVTAWTATKEFFVNLWNSIKTLATEAWTAVTNAIMVVLSPFIAAFMNVWNGVKDGLSQAWEGIKMIAQGAWELIKNVILSQVLLLIDLLTGDFEGFSAHLSEIWQNIKDAASLIWEGIKTYLGGVISAIVGYGQAMFQNFSAALSAIWGVISSVATSIWNGIKSGLTAIWNGLVSAAIAIFNGFMASLSAIWNGIKTTASSVWEGIKTSVTSLATAAKDGAISAWNTLKDMTSSIFNGVVESIKFILNIDLFEIGKNIIQGLINGIGSMVNAVGEKISEVAGGIKDKITGALGIHSPSRWMRDMVGKNMMIGWELGIDRNAQLPKLAMDAALDDIMLPKISAESALNIGGRMATGSSTLNNYYTTNNTAQNQQESETNSLLRQILKKDQIMVVDKNVLGTTIDNLQSKAFAIKNYQVRG